MMTHNRDNRIREVHSLKDLRAYHCVDFHLLEFGGGELTRLVQDVIGNGYLANIVQQRARLESLDLEPVQTEMPCEPRGVHLNSIDVIVSYLVLRINRSGERLDRGKVDETYTLGGLGSLIGLLEIQVTRRKHDRHKRTRCQQQRHSVLNHTEIY